MLKRTAFLALLSMWLALPVFAAAQSTVAGTGSFNYTVTGFAETGVAPALCQPGPGPVFSPCPIIDDTTHQPPQLGVPFTMTVGTVGPKTSVTCTGAVPTGITMKASGTNCVLTGTLMTTGTGTTFTLTFQGT